MNADLILRKIQPVPPTLEELHRLFTLHTTWGEQFSFEEKVSVPYHQLGKLDASIHDAFIRDKMHAQPMPDMPDSVYAEDIRWKHAANRPYLDEGTRKKLQQLNSPHKVAVLRIFDLQQQFGWQQFYKEENKIQRDFSQKEAQLRNSEMVAGEKASRQVDLNVAQYTARQQLWKTHYDQYTGAFKKVHLLLDELAYGDLLTAAEKDIVLPVLGDIQSRAIEAIEKMLWAEMSLLTIGEVLYFDTRILNMTAGSDSDTKQ
ncbi:hypothetical protein [Flavihumibacter petaseus]|uniref:Uncharacterized protein n=1 Tax=Flavihumibacter petaseus NBRC 106054 TaxID=1220578 RepID=A0A0E9N3F5_9BACT|nr:hypothetical protein [Flavihumibacter petaseus]GAO44211.1 hypothetical protein FPE01S_03_02490 [Flavihumibacter petaseus NBRC 106054]